MKAKISYRTDMIEKVCNKCCPYYNVCGMDEDYDCGAFKMLVKIYEDLDCDNPNN